MIGVYIYDNKIKEEIILSWMCNNNLIMCDKLLLVYQKLCLKKCFEKFKIQFLIKKKNWELRYEILKLLLTLKINSAWCTENTLKHCLKGRECIAPYNKLKLNMVYCTL